MTAKNTPAANGRREAAKTDAAAATNPVKRSRATKPAAPAPEVQAPDTAQVEAERVADRCAAAQAAVPAVTNWLGLISTALESLDDDGARAAADELVTAAQAVRRALNVRSKGAPPRERSPKDPAACRYQLIAADGTVLKGSLYRPSVARDRAMAAKRIRDKESRPGDQQLAASTLIDTEATAS